jgi:hypothetical protein
VTRLASPLRRPTAYGHLLGGPDWTSPRGAVWSCCNGACREEEASRCIIIGWWLCFVMIHVHEISQGKWILTRRCLTPNKVMMLLACSPGDAASDDDGIDSHSSAR